MDRRAEISQIVIGLAEYYDKQLSVSQLAMYVGDLMDLSPKDLFEAVCKYRKDPKNERFPLPSKLRSMVQPEEDPESEAHLIASKLAVAVTYGTDPHGEERAKNLVGRVGWAIVQAGGGWERFNRSITREEDLPILKAQWRNLAKVFIHRGVDETLMLPSPNKDPKELLSLPQIFKSFPKRSDQEGNE